MKKRSKSIFCCFVSLYICGGSFALADTLQASEGDPNSQFALGCQYRHGRGVKKDDAKAFSLWSAAAEKGHVAAQYNLALLYANGSGVEKDDAEAIK